MDVLLKRIINKCKVVADALADVSESMAWHTNPGVATLAEV